MSKTVHSAEDREAWIGIQRKTFTRWANQYLPADSKINDLVTDLADGIYLSKLLEKISEESVGRINKNPKMDIQKLENLNQCLEFIKKHEIQLVNIGSSDILKGNEKLILGLLWTIILRFEVAGADGKAGLLLWLQRSTKGYAGVNVTDFTSSWKDGLAFNALIHRYRPDLVNYDELSANDALGNCDKAFTTAEQSLGITRLLDPEDVVESPDEKSQVAYLSQFFKLFVGQAKLESQLRAIKNAVEVTRRHDEWTSQYQAGSQAVLSFAEENRTRLEQEQHLTTTEEVKCALDEFDSYMKETKPAMAAKRAEAEGLSSTLISSKRNNNRPEFVPEIQVSAFNAAWESLEVAEQAYERKILDMYLAYQSADHAVSKFNAKAATVNTWLDEKIVVFQEGVVGESVPEIETHLEVQSSFETRFKLYENVVQRMQEYVDKVSSVPGHAGGEKVVADMVDLQNKMQSVKSMGEAHRTKLEQALATEKALVEKEKSYLRMVEEVDFTVDQLEEQVNESDIGATVSDLLAVKGAAEKIESRVSDVSSKLAQVSSVASEIQAKRPDAVEHCQLQQQRVEKIQSLFSERLTKVSEALSEEERKDQLRKAFAQAAGELASLCEGKRSALSSLSGSLESQQAECAKLREEVVGENSVGSQLLAKVNEASTACDEAKVVANPYTSHTIYSLRAQYDQLIKAMKLTDDALSAQLMAQKSLEIPAEQLKEIQEIFRVFDTDQDGKLRLSDLKEACLGAGLDLEDEELEKRMRARKSDMLFTLDDFVAFFVEEVKTGDSKEDVISAFKAMGGEAGAVTPEQVQSTLGTISKDLADYVSGHMQDGDYVKFTEQLFTR